MFQRNVGQAFPLLLTLMPCCRVISSRRNNKPWWSFWSQCHGKFLRLLVQCHIGVNELQLDDWVGRQSSGLHLVPLKSSSLEVLEVRWFCEAYGVWDKLFVFGDVAFGEPSRGSIVLCFLKGAVPHLQLTSNRLVSGIIGAVAWATNSMLLQKRATYTVITWVRCTSRCHTMLYP